ncbi:MAG TPA: methyltransferase domain-containing protein [Acidimicrobiales bacterium]|jgi:SAM-dependent methyltransferase|nr:methyltransferase domain-containing protein [Acidimicrobiales bacterium]
MPDTYTHGHQESVLRSHRWRTAANSAAYLLPHLRSGMTLLDVGCGPGTITRDLATLVAPGRVVGIDRAESVIESAASPGPVDFRVGDVYALDAADGSFDVVHAHQVLQHLSDPVAALTEMRRVLAPGGILAVRDSDYGAFLWAPDAPRLDRWREIYTEVCRRNDADANAGRHLPEWVAAAGFTGLEVSSSNWTFADAGSRTWWGGLWADRTTGSAFSGQAVDYGVASADELADVADGWRQWAAGDDGLFVVVHVEVLARP